MELLAPAGTIDKLRIAYAYGADAAYIGMDQFSLRTRAGNITDSDVDELVRIKGTKKLYGALNSYFHESDIKALSIRLDMLSTYPFDALIVSDLGAASILKNRFPDMPLHLSTQANCLNSAAAKIYRDIGFTRIILGRESPLDDIRRIKDATPDIEIEVFVHGAMCMAYSGRCFLSSFLTGRSANQGDCSHTCRWTYRLMERSNKDAFPDHELALEEEERPGEYFPVFEGEGYTTILSSKDLCMIDHLRAIADAGVDSCKIEGRMKSLYYVATTTRAYRKAIDALSGDEPALSTWQAYRNELHQVSHREYSTGFFFDKEDIEAPTETDYLRNYLFLGTVERQEPEGMWLIATKNPIEAGTTIEYIGPDILSVTDNSFQLFDSEKNPVSKVGHGCTAFIKTEKPICINAIIRRETLEKPQHRKQDQTC